MGKEAGKSLTLSPARIGLNDLLEISRPIPRITIERRMSLEKLIDLRQQLTVKPAWVLLFAKAYAKVAARMPVLRRAYIPFPRPHLFETDDSIATIAVERWIDQESTVCFARMREPNRQTLPRLMDWLETWKVKPVEQIREFRRVARISRFPAPLRKWIWWYAMNSSGRNRAKYLGTFGISVTASAGATCTNLISPLTTNLNYGVFASDGTLEVRLHFDHRVMDGMPAARALAELEKVLLSEVAAELQQMQSPDRLGLRTMDIVTSNN